LEPSGFGIDSWGLGLTAEITGCMMSQAIRPSVSHDAVLCRNG